MTSLEKEFTSLSTHAAPTYQAKNKILSFATLTSCLVLIAGCTANPPETFTFTADLPEGFAYVAAVYYVPAEGETCTVKKKDNLAPVFNPDWRKEYKPDAEIEIRITRKGCPLVVRRIELEINSAYGKDPGDFGRERAVVAIRDYFDEQYRSAFSESGESIFYGECQWLFRTSGNQRRIVKILDCKETNARGEPKPNKPFSRHSLDQLPGKTVKMKIILIEEERPYMGDTWVKVPNGWKRCMGDNFEDQYAFCFGNHKDFSHFRMPDGRYCTIYPGCTE